MNLNLWRIFHDTNKPTYYMRIAKVLLSLSALGIVSAATGNTPGTPGRVDAVDSVTLTVKWTLGTSKTNKDKAADFVIFNDKGFFHEVTSSQISKFTGKIMSLRVPRQGTYSMCLRMSNQRADANHQKFVIMENKTLGDNDTLTFKGSAANKRISFDILTPTGQPMIFSTQKGGAGMWDTVTMQKATYQQNYIIKNIGYLSPTTMTSVEYNSSTLGADRSKTLDIYVTPNASSNFVMQGSVVGRIVSKTDTLHNADPNAPLQIACVTAPFSATGKTFKVTAANYREFVPALPKASPIVRNTADTLGYKTIWMRPDGTAMGFILTGSNYASDGKIAYASAADQNSMLVYSPTYETTLKPSGCVELGVGIVNPPVLFAPSVEPVYVVPNYVYAGYVLNNYGQNGLQLFNTQVPFFDIDPTGEQPEYGNSAPIFAYYAYPTGFTSSYKNPYPGLNSNGGWIGNAGECLASDIMVSPMALIAGTDTLATEWNKRVSAIQAYEKTVHEPGIIRMVLENRNFTVDTVPGFCRAEFAYKEGNSDICPPTLTMLQLRDKSGHITNKFRKMADAVMYFTGGDLNIDAPAHSYFTYSPATIKVEIASLGSSNYTTLETQEMSDLDKMPVWGHGYKVDMSQYKHTNRTGWFQLRFTLTDAAGNTSEQFISPALYATDCVGIPSVSDAPMREVLYYDLQGRRVAEPASGVYIRVSILEDGSRRTEKLMAAPK